MSVLIFCLTSSTCKNDHFSLQKCHTYFLKIYLCVVCLSTYSCLQRSEERVRISETGVTHGCEPLDPGARNGTSVHCKGSRHSTSESSLQPLHFLL